MPPGKTRSHTQLTQPCGDPIKGQHPGGGCRAAWLSMVCIGDVTKAIGRPDGRPRGPNVSVAKVTRVTGVHGRRAQGGPPFVSVPTTNGFFSIFAGGLQPLPAIRRIGTANHPVAEPVCAEPHIPCTRAGWPWKAGRVAVSATNSERPRRARPRQSRRRSSPCSPASNSTRLEEIEFEGSEALLEKTLRFFPAKIWSLQCGSKAYLRWWANSSGERSQDSH